MRVRSTVLAPLAAWIERTWCAPERRARPAPRLLDIGCGDLLLATLLPSCRIDGVDTAPSARAAARRTTTELPLPGVVHDDAADVPDGIYDAVVMSSVVQYLADHDEVADMVAAAARWLRPDGLGVVMTDVPVPGAGRLPDAVDLCRLAVGAVGPWRAPALVVRSARRSPGDLLAVPDRVVAAAAMANGLGWHRLSANLSPLRSRATHHLIGPGGTVGGPTGATFLPPTWSE